MRKPWPHRKGGPCALPAASSYMNGKNVRRIRTICEFAEHFYVYTVAPPGGRAAAPTKSGTYFSAYLYFATDPFLSAENPEMRDTKGLADEVIQHHEEVTPGRSHPCSLYAKRSAHELGTI